MKKCIFLIIIIFIACGKDKATEPDADPVTGAKYSVVLIKEINNKVKVRFGSNWYDIGYGDNIERNIGSFAKGHYSWVLTTWNSTQNRWDTKASGEVYVGHPRYGYISDSSIYWT